MGQESSHNKKQLHCAKKNMSDRWPPSEDLIQLVHYVSAQQALTQTSNLEGFELLERLVHRRSGLNLVVLRTVLDSYHLDMEHNDRVKDLLVEAIVHNGSWLVYYLCGRNFDFNHVHTEHEQTALFWALEEYSYSVMHALLEAGADPNILDGHGRTVEEIMRERRENWTGSRMAEQTIRVEEVD